jgi:hypothetical protein
MPRDERGRWVRLPRTPAAQNETETPVFETGVLSFSLDVSEMCPKFSAPGVTGISARGTAMLDEVLAPLIPKLGRRCFKAKMGHLDIKDANHLRQELASLIGGQWENQLPTE